ncbi:hypothetical protein [Bacillus mycoides]|uniref:hypothetical protein n=1 Tax=Bacillus cereus group TaxID=86661 RepID=UPI0008729606|nr:hypothetical protein [Bacillus mycoides]OFD46316.1 hypothetical protein BWGOE2_09580 [Bacillus mycoides]OFD49226.1 hypothetical protein BWGOE1_10070 [Bacillus mycoides]OFD63983.1 hypothetical protein BWGOE6_09640 [Bacillus mycoides]
MSVVLEENKKGDIDYQISEVRYVINILNECPNNNNIDFDDVINEIKLIYSNLYPPSGGISDFFIWKADFNERVKANGPLGRIGDELGEMLKELIVKE